jgi:hypothetical protein
METNMNLELEKINLQGIEFFQQAEKKKDV